MSSYQRRAKRTGGQHPGELAAGWALGKTSGKNDGINNRRRVGESVAGSWLWRNLVLAKFSMEIGPGRCD